ncbi:restriction endonuclease subunit S, partial [Streptomyces anulatus]|uniref:restriction endonuclease subunit S n=1 Tax=Streptomyces anulatus TaxID=1892 RepID=UPI003433C048
MTARPTAPEGLTSRSMPIGRPGTLLFAMYASVGEVAFLDISATWNQALLGITPDPDRIDSRFLRYVLLDMRDDLLRDVRSNTQSNLNAGQVGDIWFQRPPLEEQRAIADYLDRETARIDTLIEEQQRLIEMLVSRKSAVADAVVTRGMDADSRLVDSGVDWIGPIPEGWQIRPLWSMFRRIKDVDHPEEQMLSVFRDYGVVAKDSRNNINKTAENRSIYQLVHPGWLVTNRMKAWQGSVGISSLRGIVSGHYICFAPLHSEDDAYLNWLFRSPRYALGYGLISRGVRIGQAEIDNDHYRVLPVVVPPLEEQRRIAACLEEQTAKIDALIAETERFIQLAHERRAALITAAVTGQIDVREMA